MSTFVDLATAATLARLAADSGTHPHVVVGFYDDEVKRLMEGDPGLRKLAEGEALANCVAKFSELAKHRQHIATKRAP